MEEEAAEAGGSGEENKEVAKADSWWQQVEAGPAFSSDSGTHLAVKVAS